MSSLVGKYLLVTMYRRGRIAYLVCRREGDLRRVTFRLVDFYPYFYVPDPAGTYRAIDGARVKKIVLDDPSKVPEVRKNYARHYEADVVYIERVAIDLGIGRGLIVKRNSIDLTTRDIEPCDDVNVPVRKWYIDIEVLAPEMPDPADPKYEIILLTIYDSYEQTYLTLVQHPEAGEERVVEREGNWYVWYFPDEKSLLEFFLRLWREVCPDLVMGWNVPFDVSYLVNRMRMLGLSLPYEEADYLDLLYMYRDFLKVRQPGYKLKEVAYREGLAESPEPLVKDITSAYREDLDRLILYNKMDVYYVVELDRRYEMSDFALALKWAVGLPRIARFEHENGKIRLVAEIHNHKLIDVMLLRIAKRRGVVLPSKPEHREEGEESYKGAIVLQPPQGLIEWVCVFDMSRYYPSIIVSFNLSPETLTRDVSDPGRVIHVAGLFYRRDQKGIIPELAEYFVKRREEIEARLKQLQPGTPEYERLKRERDAVKYLANAVYGVMGFVGFRLFKREVAETVTAIGREGILKICEIARELGYNPVYGDSVSEDSTVPVVKDGEIKHVKIGELWRQLASRAVSYVRPDDKEELHLHDENLLTIVADHHGNVKTARIVRIIKHRVAKRWYRICTELGTCVEVTEDHSIVVTDDDFTRLFLKRPAELDVKRDRLIFLDVEQGRAIPIKIGTVDDLGVLERDAYDLEVEDHHVFFANNILVHNTDSVFIQILPEGLSRADDDRERLRLVVETAQRVVEVLNQRISQYLREKYGVPDPKIKLKFERVFRRVIFAGVKKRYAGLVVWEDGKECSYLMVKGFEAVRSDTPPFTQEVQKRLFELILSGASREEILSFLREKIREFRDKCARLDVNDIAIPKGLSKNVDEYEHHAPHVRAVIYSNMYLGKCFTRGAKVKIVYVKSVPGLPPTDVIAIEDSSDLPPGTVIDVDTMLEKALFQKIDKILELVGLSVDTLKQKRATKLFA